MEAIIVKAAGFLLIIALGFVLKSVGLFLRIHASEITETLRAKTAAYEDALKAFRRTLQEGKDGKTARNAASAVL